MELMTSYLVMALTIGYNRPAVYRKCDWFRLSGPIILDGRRGKFSLFPIQALAIWHPQRSFFVQIGPEID